jgi:hypothetical protein
MQRWKRAAAWAAMLAICAAPGPAFPAAKDGIYNKEGYWRIDADQGRGSCNATMTLQGGSFFVLRAVKGGRLTFGLMSGRNAAIVRAQAGRIETEAYGVDFRPSYTPDALVMFSKDDLDARAIAALRLARQVRLLADGQTVASMTFEGTGFESALDGVLACSRGQAGWWGAGLGAARAENDSATQRVDPRGVLNKEGVWTVGADGEKCFGSAPLKSGGEFILMGDAGRLGFGVGLRQPPRQGRQGAFQTEAYSFDFRPSYTKDGMLYMEDYIGQNGLAALRLARDLRITVDGREMMQAHVEGTGLDGVLDAVLQCSRGRSGWWGQGAKVQTASRPAPDREPAPGREPAPAAGGTGSAFFITADGVAVTAAHVVEGCRSVVSPRWGVAKVLAADKAADLAILKIASASGEFVPLRVRGPRLGEPMTAAGYPLGDLLGSGLKITTGVVSGLAGPEGDRGLFQLSAPIQPGNSGGPVIDADGALIGVTEGKLDEVKVAAATGIFPQNVNFAVPVTVLASFLDENGVTYRAASAAPKGPAPAVGMTGYTFELVCRP